jgi:signal transduction histidine kinase
MKLRSPGHLEMSSLAAFAAKLGLLAILISSPAFAFAQQGGTAVEAKAMLEKAVAAVKADKAKALDEFNNGTGGFKDRDLYVFCAQASDGKIVAVLANPNAKSLIGTDQRTLKDATGKEFGKELFAAAQKPEGQFTEVTYMFPRPGADPKPVPKVSLVTRVNDLGCGVGYYK